MNLAELAPHYLDQSENGEIVLYGVRSNMNEKENGASARSIGPNEFQFLWKSGRGITKDRIKLIREQKRNCLLGCCEPTIKMVNDGVNGGQPVECTFTSLTVSNGNPKTPLPTSESGNAVK